MQSRWQVSFSNFKYGKDVCVNSTHRPDFTNLYAELRKGIPLVMSPIIIRDRDIGKKVCTALQQKSGEGDEVIRAAI